MEQNLAQTLMSPQNEINPDPPPLAPSASQQFNILFVRSFAIFVKSHSLAGTAVNSEHFCLH